MNDQLFSAKGILGLEPLSTRGEDLLLVMYSAPSGEVALSVLQKSGNQWSELKRLQNLDSARSMDTQVVDGELLVALETNSYWPINVSRCRLDDLLDPRQSPLALQPVGQAELSSEQIQRIDLPVTSAWSVAGPLSPREWLFNPRFIPGEAHGVLLVNTADRQAVLVSPTGLSPEAGRFAHPNAFAPQAIAGTSSGRMLAFLRMKEKAHGPFWTLSRYQGTSVPHPGALTVVEGNGPEQDLSAALGIGPIFDFRLVQANGQLWLFALNDAAVGTQVIALQRDASGWKVRGKLDVDKEIQMMAVAPHGQAWSLFLVMEAKQGVSIHHRLWDIPRASP